MERNRDKIRDRGESAAKSGKKPAYSGAAQNKSVKSSSAGSSVPRDRKNKKNTKQNPGSRAAVRSNRAHSAGQAARRRIPVYLLTLFLLLACFFLGRKYLADRREQTPDAKDEVMTIYAPQLSQAADAFLFVKDGEAILMDTGVTEDSETLIHLLDQQHITNLKALILTHYDKDHIGGAAAVLDHVSVERCYMSCASADSEEYEALMDALDRSQAEQIMLTEACSFSELGGEWIIYPPLSYDYSSNQDNNCSLITEITFMGQHLLYAGDAQKERINEYLKEQYDGTSFCFLKMPHHGRSTKVTRALLEVFQPEICLITSSDEEPEEEEVMELLEEAHVETYLTREGSVTMKVNQNGISLQQ